MEAVTDRKSEEYNEVADGEKKVVEKWIERFDNLVSAICKSGQVDRNGVLHLSLKKAKSDEEILVKVNIKDYQQIDTKCAIDKCDRLLIKERKGTTTKDEILNCSTNIEDEEIGQNEYGYLVIKAPLLAADQNQPLSEDRDVELDKMTPPVSGEAEPIPQHWNQLFNQFASPIANNVERKD